MNSPAQTGAHSPAPSQTSANGFEQEWLSVDQAVAYCGELGLKRTPKTVRKWAERSSGLPDGDIISRKQETLWGYRWQIEKSSLTRKVDEELQLQAANDTEPVRTSSVEQITAPSELTLPHSETLVPNPAEPVRTSSDTTAPVQPKSDQQNQSAPGAHPFEPVPTRSETELVLDEVRERLLDKDKEIEFLREQLADAQAEIGRRASSTDDALKTIDRVVRSFELQAEANRATVLEAGKMPAEPPQDAFVPGEPIDNPQGLQDIRRV